jgi:glycosyltransferase involved in cell wall biosynthesis
MGASHEHGGIPGGVSIVIPALNEANRLPQTLDVLCNGLPALLGDAWEIVVVDDGSTDDTAGVVQRRARHSAVRLISFGENRGKGAALRQGAISATRPLVLFLDADLPVRVETIAEFARLGEHADLVVGSRRLPGASFDPPQPLTRRLGGAGFRAAVALLGYEVTSDPQCGIKLLRTEAFAGVLPQLTCERFSFDVELIERARRAGLRIDEIPVTWRHVEGSTLRPLPDAVATLRDLVRLRRRLLRRPAPSTAERAVVV